jgi:hypothetical protein
MNTAIVFFSHVFDPTATAHLDKLRSESAEFGTFFVYADSKGQAPPPGDRTVTFDFASVRSKYSRIFGEALLPGNCHLTLLDFFKRYPDFQYYWVIEYDVMFSGHWGVLFGAFAERQADFLASHIRSHQEEPGFYFWNSIADPADATLPSRGLIRAFCPVQRLSRRALQFLELKAQEGWIGHFEGLVPTLLERHGYALEDIGGDGRYVPRGFKNRFYTSFTWTDGRLRHFGSMRFRPVFQFIRHARRNMLYHPVKHSVSGSRSPLKVLASRREQMAYVIRHLRTRPFSFGGALCRFFLSTAVRRRG